MFRSAFGKALLICSIGASFFASGGYRLAHGQNTFPASGNVGIGITTPANALDVNGSLHVTGNGNLNTAVQGAYLGWNLWTGVGETDFINNAGYGGGGFAFLNTPQSGSPDTTLMFLTGSGQLGVGTRDISNGITVVGGINVDNYDDNDGTNNFPTNQSTLGISFGDASGEGIGSARSGGFGSRNQYGLDFFTGFAKRLSITQTGNVGIGTTTPTTALEVNGSVKLTPGSGGSITFADGSIQTSASMSGSAVYSSSTGNVGIGTTNPAGTLDVAGGSSQGGLVVAGRNLDPVLNYPLTSLQNSGKLLIGWNRSAGAGETDFVANAGGGSPGGYTFYTYSNVGQLNPLVAFIGSGNVGIGTTAPGAKLEVNGNLKFTSGSGASMTFPDGTVQATAWNGTTLGGDYAESVDVGGERATYEPGDVIVIDDLSPGSFGKTQTPYSTLVAGVYSTKPGLVGRRTTVQRPNKDAEVPMAMTGIVPTKVTTENGPIKPGDILVSSGTAGFAMKGTDRDRLTGAIIGKALAPLKSGSGVIEVLLALQ